jgi:hypothetical protein
MRRLPPPSPVLLGVGGTLTGSAAVFDPNLGFHCGNVTRFLGFVCHTGANGFVGHLDVDATTRDFDKAFVVTLHGDVSASESGKEFGALARCQLAVDGGSPRGCGLSYTEAA